MDGGTQWDDESSNGLAHAVLLGALVGHRNSGGRRGRTQSSGVSRKHVLERGDGVDLGDGSSQGELQDEQDQRAHHGHDQNHEEHADGVSEVAVHAHGEEHTEDVDRQQGNDESLDNLHHHVTQLVTGAQKAIGRNCGHRQAHAEGQ